MNYLIASLLTFCTILQTILIHCTDNNDLSTKELYPFSFEEIQSLPPIIPENPSAIVIFYHGAGLYTNKTHQWIGLQLQKEFNVGCYMVDIRGHGHSGGPRGDTPTIEQVWKDVDTFVENVKHRHPDLPLYLAGHSSGSGLLLNYNAFSKKSDDIQGYIFIAPYLGPNSGTLKEHKNPQQNFVKKMRLWVYILNSLISWNFLQHIHAVFFNYPAFLLKEDPLIVTSYSYAMSAATTPYEVQKLFAQLTKPFAIYIGQYDEQFLPEKVVAYKKEQAIAEIVPQEKHLSILLKTPELIAKTIWRWKK